MRKKMAKDEILEVFETLKIDVDSDYCNQNFEVWEVPPIQKGTHIFTKSY